MNGKYKWIVNESRRLHEAGVTPAVCDKILYEHAIELVRIINVLIILTLILYCHFCEAYYTFAPSSEVPR